MKNSWWSVRSALTCVAAIALVLGSSTLLLISNGTGGVPAVNTTRDPDLGRSVPPQEEEVIPYVGAPHSPYNSWPPTSGATVAQTLAPGIYEGTIPPELQVSSLRQGLVIVQYAQSTGASEVAVLADVFRKHFRSMILCPDVSLGQGVFLTAWGLLDYMPTVDAARIHRFVDAVGYVGQ